MGLAFASPKGMFFVEAVTFYIGSEEDSKGGDRKASFGLF
jgi:hypothetical protein